MPIYEYECVNCGGHHEAMQKFTDDPLTTCPVCGGDLRKLISHTSFVLKGSGWYVTDYASGDRKKAMEADKPAGEKPEGTKTAEAKGEATTSANSSPKPQGSSETSSET